MKGTKSILLLLVSFLLFAVSFTLLWTWGYRVYIKKTGEEGKAGVSVNATAAPASTRDSLQIVYSATVNQLDNHLNAVWNNTDSLKGQLDKKLGEFYRLRNEIANLLKDHETDANLGLAKQKIEALQQKVRELVDKNADVENENRKLAAVLQQLAAGKKNPESNAQRTSYDNSATEKSNAAAPLSVSELRLAALTTENDREQETTQAQKTEKLVGSFMIKNGSEPGNTSEVMIVVLQPDGQVVKNSAWESGTFITSEGKKVYSYKMRFDNSHEPKRLLFSLSPDNYQKGNYTMQVWYNGTLVGRVMKTLS